MARFSAQEPTGAAVQQLEVLVRTAVFKSANALVGFLLQQAADRRDATYQAQPGEHWKGRETLQLRGMFGAFPLARDYYYHPGKKQGHYPADAALGLEVAYTPALARLLCLEGADEMGYEKAQQHLAETGGIDVCARQIQRVVQRVGGAAQVPAMKKVAGGLRLDLASFRELEAFAQLGTDLDPATQARLDRGYHMTELLKQGLYQPMHVTDQVLSIYAGTRGHLDKIPIGEVHNWEQGFLQFIREERAEIWKKITDSKQIDDAGMAAVDQAIAEFQKRYAAEHSPKETVTV